MIYKAISKSISKIYIYVNKLIDDEIEDLLIFKKTHLYFSFDIIHFLLKTKVFCCWLIARFSEEFLMHLFLVSSSQKKSLYFE